MMKTVERGNSILRTAVGRKCVLVRTERENSMLRRTAECEKGMMKTVERGNSMLRTAVGKKVCWGEMNVRTVC